MLSLILEALAYVNWSKLIWPLSVPLIFVVIWYGTYALSDAPTPAGAVRATVIWLIAMFVALPLALGFAMLAGIAGHGGFGFAYLCLGLAVLVWRGIIPVLIVKTVRAEFENHNNA